MQSRTGECLYAQNVVLALGMSGNPRTLDIPGAQLPCVHYALADPAAYHDEVIVVIGAGDSAVETALALAERNTVFLLNRREEFSRPKQGNLDAVLKAIQHERLDCFYSTTPLRIDAHTGREPYLLTIAMPRGVARMGCHRIIACLGAVPPREFLQKLGVHFASAHADAPPLLSPRYEASVPGLYLIGSITGYPLIKHAINQGYEVIEALRGQPALPLDEGLLLEKFKLLYQRWRAFPSVTVAVATFRAAMPLFAPLSPPQLRELLLESTIHLPQPGDIIFRYNDYSNSFFYIIVGETHIELPQEEFNKTITLRHGQFFGEMGLLSGRRRSATVRATGSEPCVLLEIPRRAMHRLIASHPEIQHGIDRVFAQRAIQARIAPEVPASDLAAVVQSARLERYAAGEILFTQGAFGDCLYLIRKGSIMITRVIGGREIVLSYLAAGNYLGEMALLNDTPRTANARAAVETEVLRLEGAAFKALLARSPDLRRKVEAKYQERLLHTARMEVRPQAGNLLAFLMAQGLSEATEVVLIDENLCVECNHCEWACADTHHGTARLDRSAGQSFASVRIPTSCRHCEHPHCMKDCPPDAIHRAPNGEVFIADNCIGCGHCRDNCPYGVIRMAVKKRKRAWLPAWILFGWGHGPGEGQADAIGNAQAVKCDLCATLPGGPACVRACPTGAAFRASPEILGEVIQVYE